ncbi:MAG: response regulator [Desulfarculus sp.]|nr:MAG: response regulator [Desulfarculus sp.]
MNQNDQAVPVLVIDDERDIRDGCERILSRMGCRVATAADGRAGLEALEREPAACVLLDLKMPGMDGLEVLQRIKQSHPQALVIIITGFATVETAIEAMKLGAYDFIPKPFQPDQLRLTVRRALERLQLSQQAARLQEERRRTLSDLDTEKSRLRTIISALPLGVLVTRPDGQVVLLNPAFCQMVGLDPAARPGGDLSTYLPAPEACELARRVSLGQANQEETPSLEFTTHDERYLLAQATPILNEEGKGLGAVLVLVDVTAFKMLDRLRSEFVAKVSHELRSPLSTILLQLTLLLGEGGAPRVEGQRHLLVRARERTQGLISFVRDLLDLSRLEDGAGWQEPQEVHLEETLRAVMDSLSTQAEIRGHQMILDLPAEPLPALTADPVGLESVFNNLMANAINYSPDHGRIQVTARNQGGSILVEVADQGFGIEPEKQALIFEKFYRVKNEKTRYVTGTGLGLPIVKSVLESLGGSVSVASEPGRGTTFTVVLPAGGC